MYLLKILLLAVVQGLCELLPVSSSAHVIVVSKLLGLDPTTPEMTLLLVALHTGTMFAVILYFWRTWQREYFASAAIFWRALTQVVIATAVTGVIGICLLLLIEKVILRGQPHAEVEHLFGNLTLVAAALASVGLLIIVAGGRDTTGVEKSGSREVQTPASVWIGAVQGLCLPFRGFSRSGATISTGLLLGVARQRAESFSFALAVVLTPPVIVREVHRLWKARAAAAASGVESLHWSSFALPSLLGMAASFVAGLLALRWLSSWLEHGRWRLFGYYCLFAAVVVFLLGRWY